MRAQVHSRLMLITENIAVNWKIALDRYGIKYREYVESDYIEYLKEHDPALMEKLLVART